jgi:hypothetical protein
VTPAQRVRLLFGPYRTPAFRYGDRMYCTIRGEVEVVGLAPGPIPWPVGRLHKGHRQRFLILCGALVLAVRRESAAAVGHWWGVSAFTVHGWRKALGVAPMTEGTRRLHQEAFAPHMAKALAAALPTLGSPGRRAKIAAAMRGKPRPLHVGQAVGRSRKGVPHSQEAKRRMSQAHKARGSGGANPGRPWTPEEDALVRALGPIEAARRAGRTLKAVWSRRHKLGVNRVEG